MQDAERHGFWHTGWMRYGHDQNEGLERYMANIREGDVHQQCQACEHNDEVQTVASSTVYTSGCSRQPGVER